MAKHWQNVLAGADYAMEAADKANKNRNPRFGQAGIYDGHTCEEWVAIHIRRAKRAAEMFDKTKAQESFNSSQL